MIIKFQKFQGAGNDFIIIDNRNQVYEFTREIVNHKRETSHGSYWAGSSSPYLREKFS